MKSKEEKDFEDLMTIYVLSFVITTLLILGLIWYVAKDLASEQIHKPTTNKPKLVIIRVAPNGSVTKDTIFSNTEIIQ